MSNANFFFPSDGLLTPKDSHDKIEDTRSSGATALATGLAALVLFYLKLEHNDKTRMDKPKAGEERTKDGSATEEEIDETSEKQQRRQKHGTRNEVLHVAGNNARANMNDFFSRITDTNSNWKYVNITEILKMRQNTQASYKVITVKWKTSQHG